MRSWEYDILSTLLRHKAGSLQDTVKIQFGSAVLLAIRRPLGYQLRGIHLRAKMHWAKMDATNLMTEGPPEGKEHRRPQLYFDSVLEGSRLWRSNVLRISNSHEYTHVILSCTMKQIRYVI